MGTYNVIDEFTTRLPSQIGEPLWGYLSRSIVIQALISEGYKEWSDVAIALSKAPTGDFIRELSAQGMEPQEIVRRTIRAFKPHWPMPE